MRKILSKTILFPIRTDGLAPFSVESFLQDLTNRWSAEDPDFDVSDCLREIAALSPSDRQDVVDSLQQLIHLCRLRSKGQDTPQDKKRCIEIEYNLFERLLPLAAPFFVLLLRGAAETERAALVLGRCLYGLFRSAYPLGPQAILSSLRRPTLGLSNSDLWSDWICPDNRIKGAAGWTLAKTTSGIAEAMTRTWKLSEAYLDAVEAWLEENRHLLLHAGTYYSRLDRLGPEDHKYHNEHFYNIDVAKHGAEILSFFPHRDRSLALIVDLFAAVPKAATRMLMARPTLDASYRAALERYLKEMTPETPINSEGRECA